MEPVYLTARQTADALGISYYTVIRYAKAGKQFPSARLRNNSRTQGYRIPDADVLAYAMREGHDVLKRAQAKIAEIRAERDRESAAS